MQNIVNITLRKMLTNIDIILLQVYSIFPYGLPNYYHTSFITNRILPSNAHT